MINEGMTDENFSAALLTTIQSYVVDAETLEMSIRAISTALAASMAGLSGGGGGGVSSCIIVTDSNGNVTSISMVEGDVCRLCEAINSNKDLLDHTDRVIDSLN